ncbi:MAG: hypothetical protein AAFN10_18680, partial [Bacteroidota bacterium]
LGFKFPLKASLSTALYKTHFGAYQIDVPNEISRRGFGNKIDYRLSLSYPISNRLSLGASMLTYSKEEDIFYQEPTLLGAMAIHPHTAEPIEYGQTEVWQRINNKYLSLFLEADLIKGEKFFVSARFGFAYALVRNTTWQFNLYGEGRDQIIIDDGYFPEVATDENVNLPGVEGGLKVGYKIIPNLGISLSSNYLFSTSFVDKDSKLQYGNLELGLDFQIAKLEKNTRSNTLMVGLGRPFSISYERLLAKRKSRHSIRLFYDEYWQDGMAGIAYNIKVGKENHFFLVEPAFYLNEEPFAGAQLGYEFRGGAGVVVRLDGGLMLNQYDLIPRFQAHIGYAF